MLACKGVNCVDPSLADEIKPAKMEQITQPIRRRFYIFVIQISQLK